MKAVVWDDEGLGAKYHDEEIPAELLEQAQGISPGHDRSGRRTDDDVMDAYLDGKEPDEAT